MRFQADSAAMRFAKVVTVAVVWTVNLAGFLFAWWGRWWGVGFLLLTNVIFNRVYKRRLDKSQRALKAARDELGRWGWGDMHYGSTPQEASVVDTLAVIDEAIA